MRWSTAVLLFIALFIKSSSGAHFAKATNKHLRASSSSMSSSSTSSLETKTLLLKHPGTCSGMFWRGNPETKASAPSNDNWPRNGALLQGSGPYVVDGEAYFNVSSIQQAGKSGFVPVPEGTYMLYNQEGKVLHEV